MGIRKKLTVLVLKRQLSRVVIIQLVLFAILSLVKIRLVKVEPVTTHKLLRPLVPIVLL